MENKCLICNSTNTISLKTGNNNFNHFICTECGLIYIWPPPEKRVLESYYKEDKSAREQGVDLNSSGKNLKMSLIGAMNQAKYIIENSGLKKNKRESSKRIKKVLEIGSSTGSLLNAFKVRGFDVLGIEPSKLAFEYSRSRYNLSVINNILENVKLNEKFDLILCIHMLEHVQDPHIFLTKIRKLLKKQGILYIKVSNVYKPRMNLKRFFTPLHLINYSPRSLVNMLALNKFRIIKSNTNGSYIDMFFVKDSKIKLKTDKIEYNKEIDFLRKYKRDYFIKLNFLAVIFREKIYPKIINLLIRLFPASLLDKIKKKLRD